MKTKLMFVIVALLALSPKAIGQGTAFTYQGRLTDNGTPASGNYDLSFAVYDALVGGNRIGNPLTNAAVVVTEGAFTVTLDFGADIFPGANRWLEIAVRTNGTGAFTVLSPLQPFTAAPYAITAGAVTDANLSRLQVPNTAAPATGVPTVTSGFITAATVLQSGLGYSSPPTVTVTDTNGSGAVIIATVQGGKVVALTVQNPGAGYSTNAILTISPPPSNAFQTFITPNFFTGINVMTNPGNFLTGSFTGDGTGLTNVTASSLSGAAAVFWQLGGNPGSVAGLNFLGTADNQALELKVNKTRAFRLEPNTNGAPNVVGGSPVNVASPGVVGATIGGGGATVYSGAAYTNGVSADFGTVSGGANNAISTRARNATVGGGSNNRIRADSAFSTISGGGNNIIETNAASCVISGGNVNDIQANGLFSTISGGNNNLIQTNARSCTIGGGEGNGIQASARYSTMSGGVNNLLQPNSFGNTVAGGEGNTIQASVSYSTIGGGTFNLIGSNIQAAAIGGGYNNMVNGSYATVAGGYANSAAGAGSFAAGSQAHADHSGAFVWADGSAGTTFGSTAVNQFLIRAAGGVGIGLNNPAGALSVATGTGAVTVRNDGSVPGLLMTGGISPGTLRLRNALEIWPNDSGNLGGRLDVRGLNGAPTIFLTGTNGTVQAVTFISTSDRNAKENFKTVDARHFLERVAGLPISQWNFKGDPTVHVGPMAQDFYAAFGLGTDDKHIATVDEEGVALAAVQGLNQKLEEKSARILELEARLEKLERLLGAQKDESVK